MRDDFDRQAMEEKIRKNIEAGWTFPKIKEALMDEKKAVLERMQTLEARVVELSDQIEYMEGDYESDTNVNRTP